MQARVSARDAWTRSLPLPLPFPLSRPHSLVICSKQYSNNPCPVPKHERSTLTPPNPQVSASKDNTDMIALLLEHGANVHALPSHIPGRPSSIPADSLPRGDSPLHYAAINGSVEACDQLLSLGAAVDRYFLRILGAFLSVWE